MNLTEVHHKSLAGINKLPADLWWTWLKFITNHWLGLTSCQLIVLSLPEVHHKSLAGIEKLPADLRWTSVKFIANHSISSGRGFVMKKLPNWLKSCRRYVCTHVPACWWVHAVCVCVFNLAGGVHPSPFLVSSFNSPWQPVTPLVHPTVSWRDEIFRPTETVPGGST